MVFMIEIASGKCQNFRIGVTVLKTPMYTSLIYSAVQGMRNRGCI